MTRAAGRHFLQIPGPTNVPDRILRAIDRPTIDHRGPEFAALGLHILDEIKEIFGCSGPVILYPASGSGAWTAAMVNTLSPGDKVLMYETGQFSTLWSGVARSLGLDCEVIPSDWRRGAVADAIGARLAEDSAHEIKAVCIVHNETATGCRSDLPAIRRAIDAAGHPALFMVDTVSSLGSMDFRQDEWGVDVAVAGSQKGLMLPPGLSFNGLSAKALAAYETARLPKAYWDWHEMLKANEGGFFPYTPATNLLYGLAEAIAMLKEEGLANVFARHDRFAEATRAAAQAWDLEIVCQVPEDYSSSVTTLMAPEGHSADALRKVILERFDMSLGAGLGKLAGKVFRIGHLGDLNDLTLLGTLAGVEIGLKLAGVPHRAGGVDAAMAVLAAHADGLGVAQADAIRAASA